MLFHPETLLPLFAAACAAGLLSCLMPEGAHSRMSTALKGVTGLCLLLLLAQPVREGLTLLREVSENPDALTERLNELLRQEDCAEDGYSMLAESIGEGTRAELEAWVTARLDDTFGIPEGLCRVTVEVGIEIPREDGSGLTASAQRVWIQLTGQAVTVNPHAVEAYFARELECDCTVSIGG